MATFQLDILTPAKKAYSGRVQSLQAPGSEGSFGVLPGHAPMLSALGIGRISFVEENGANWEAATSGGFAEVQRDHVILLVETEETGTQIDVARARAARDRALERLAQQQNIDRARAQAALARALNRLRVAHTD